MNEEPEEVIDNAVDTIGENEHKNEATDNISASDSESEKTKDEQSFGGALTIEDKPAKNSRKKRLIIASAATVFVLTLISAVPFLRYGFVGMVVSRQVAMTIIDASTKKPVSDAKVSLGRFDGVSDNKGLVIINSVPVGEYTLVIEKKNYETLKSSYTVPVFMPARDTTRGMKATGRTVTVTVTNILTGRPVAGAKVDIEGSTAASDDKGVASVALPAKSDDQQGTVKADGYNDQGVTISMKTNDDQKVEVKLTPAGKVYFLSKRTGVINVMSANLDGSGQAIVVQGTGKELDNETSLLPSPDWSTLVLIARRDNERSKLYVVSTANPVPKLIEGGDVSYEPIGWTGGKFYYKLRNNTGNLFDANNQQLISYDVDSGVRQVVDGTVGVGTNWSDYSAQQMTTVYISSGRVIYMKYWQHSSAASNKNRSFEIMSINPSGNIRTVIKTIAANGEYYGDAMMRRPNSIVFRQGTANNQGTYYEYAGGSVATISMETADFYANHPTYQMSPSGERALWQESRDGKNVLFVADKNLANGSQISIGDYATYGWVGEDYVLYSKNRSELYIAPAGSELKATYKISDYHKATTYPSYGWGAGGAN
jgi:hypothetical protein